MSGWDPDYVREVRIKQLARIVEGFGRLHGLNLPGFNDTPGSPGDPASQVLKFLANARTRKLVIIEDGKITTEI